MLDFSIKYKERLQGKYIDIWYKEKYKYFFNSACQIFGIDEHTWDTHDFVSLDKDGNIIGNIYYSVNRNTLNAERLCAVNFTDDIYTFGKDLLQVLRDIFEKFNFNKLSFCVVIGNPIEKSYDKLVQKYGGRIVGIKRKEFKLFDNKYYDCKQYEILREDYLRSK
jgi:hypothetical protein